MRFSASAALRERCNARSALSTEPHPLGPKAATLPIESPPTTTPSLTVDRGRRAQGTAHSGSHRARALGFRDSSVHRIALRRPSMRHLHDVGHPAHDHAMIAVAGNPLERVYRAIDAAIGGITGGAGDDVTLPFSRRTGCRVVVATLASADLVEARRVDSEDGEAGEATTWGQSLTPRRRAVAAVAARHSPAARTVTRSRHVTAQTSAKRGAGPDRRAAKLAASRSTTGSSKAGSD